MPYKDPIIDRQKALERYYLTGGCTLERKEAHRQRELDRRHNDPVYREKINAANRKSYWKYKGAKHGICSICLRENIKLVRDHSHTTGLDRDKICNNCNLILGHARDSMVVLERAIKYLERYH